MARQTAAERRAEEAAETVAQYEKEKASYPHRLMKAMAAFSEIHNYEFVMTSDDPLAFRFRVRDGTGYQRFDEIVPAEMGQYNDLYALEGLERLIEDHYAEEREQQRRYEVLKEAKRKVNTLLNDEERQLLGIN